MVKVSGSTLAPVATLAMGTTCQAHQSCLTLRHRDVRGRRLCRGLQPTLKIWGIVKTDEASGAARRRFTSDCSLDMKRQEFVRRQYAMSAVARLSVLI